jgi:hypothetical protein
MNQSGINYLFFNFLEILLEKLINSNETKVDKSFLEMENIIALGQIS